MLGSLCPFYKTQQSSRCRGSVFERLNHQVSLKFLLISYSTNYACGDSNYKQKIKKLYYYFVINYIAFNSNLRQGRLPQKRVSSRIFSSVKESFTNSSGVSKLGQRKITNSGPSF